MVSLEERELWAVVYIHNSLSLSTVLGEGRAMSLPNIQHLLIVKIL